MAFGNFYPFSLSDCNLRIVKYSTLDCELLAAYLSVKYFLHMLKWSVFSIYIDHKPLGKLLKQKQIAILREKYATSISSLNTLRILDISQTQLIRWQTPFRASTSKLLHTSETIDLQQIVVDQENNEELSKLQNSSYLKFLLVLLSSSPSQI